MNVKSFILIIKKLNTFHIVIAHNAEDHMVQHLGFIEVDSSSFKYNSGKKILNLFHLNYAKDYFLRIVVQILCSLMGVKDKYCVLVGA